jgi:CheY-like chemotaxis protein
MDLFIYVLRAVEGLNLGTISQMLDADIETLDKRFNEIKSRFAHLSNKLALVIEDEPLISMQLESLLYDQGHDICATVSKKFEAISFASEFRPSLILADVQLADGSSGIDAVEEILRIINPAVVVFISAYPEKLLHSNL